MINGKTVTYNANKKELIKDIKKIDGMKYFTLNEFSGYLFAKKPLCKA